ncbi:SAM-dependent methyltransferase [Haliangium ochraceum]|uniref:Uroporphyrin-III C/tetrapyrrole (Corrin/Porphyrin) methyltransferase n=1 Tax=Haliangium ochraceum (strain DSM 14365 / JCM 11303 / SMP-2) TaxID=502025 RepID=D0LR89_HALO1|nr:SAM-dependent methyltransferase [Haliangium ochraceum]ACY17117.1 Uroporphyrin-III C/tetrapyrrole (Corrin/Porphyrin) methyltransferase [Haliangium ochraceum DSM 14365]
MGTGILGGGQTTLGAQRAIERADMVLFAVADPLTVAWLRSHAPNAESLPYPMDDTPRRQTYLEMVTRILAPLEAGKNVCAVFYGHPGMLAFAPHEAVRRARARGHRARMLPGVSALDCLIADLGVDLGADGCQTYEATDFLIRSRPCDPRVPLVLWQIGGIGNLSFFDSEDREGIARGLSVLTEVLRATYPAEHEVIVYEAASLPTEPPRMDSVRLDELPHASVADISTLFVPPARASTLDREMLTRLGMAPRPEGEHAAATSSTGET